MGMGATELKDILDKHGKWLRNESGGVKANLRSANLSYADLRSANLSYADLSYADLSYANLRSANLSYANLRSANLSYANLRSANLSYANLSSVKDDFFKVLTDAKAEVAGLYDALLRGKIDGSTYSGECACLVGTIANVRHVNVETLKCDSSREAEKWFMAINKGDVPRSNAVSKITKGWIEEFCQTNSIALPKYKLVSSEQFPEVFK